MSRTERRRREADALRGRIADDTAVTRRDFLRTLVTVSGGLFAGSVAVAMGLFRRFGEGRGDPVLVADRLRPGEAAYFDFPAHDDQAIAIRLADGSLVAYSAVCTHLACSVLWNREESRLDCPCHDGAFHASSGEVAFGPPPRPLPKIRLEERDDGIWATEVVEA
jgi:Rieske Fe-S protein